MKRTAGIYLFIVIWTLTSFAQQQESERFSKVVNRLVELINKKDYAGIVQEYDAGMSAAFPLNNTTLLFQNYESQYGNILKVGPPQVKAADQAVCVIYYERGAQNLTIYINDQDKIKGFIFTAHTGSESPAPEEPKPASTPTAAQTTTPIQAAEQKPAPAQTTPTVAPPTQTANPPVKQPAAPVVSDKQQTELYPPFKGAWMVVAGGKSREGAGQSNLLLQEYAYEFSARDTVGSRYKINGKVNEDYFGYGRDVLAPANGTVVETIDGIRGNSPGVQNPYAPIGNTIIIQHSNREYSVLAFLKQGSIRVKVGDKVTRGQVIAQCGNSGSAVEPVIHYHLQDSPYLQTAKGIKFYFERALIVKGGKRDLQLIHLPVMGETMYGE